MPWLLTAGETVCVLTHSAHTYPYTHSLSHTQLYCVTKDPALAAQFKAAMLEFNKPPANGDFTAALRAAPAFASLCTIAGLVSFNYGVPLANAGANIGAWMLCVWMGVCVDVYDGTYSHFSSMPSLTYLPTRTTQTQWATRRATPSRRRSPSWMRAGWCVLFYVFAPVVWSQIDSKHALILSLALSLNEQQGINKMEPGQWVNVKMSKFPTDSVAVVKLLDRNGNNAATVGTSRSVLCMTRDDDARKPALLLTPA